MNSSFKVAAVKIASRHDEATFDMRAIVQNLLDEPVKLDRLSMRRVDKDRSVHVRAAHFADKIVQPKDFFGIKEVFDDNADHFHFLNVQYTRRPLERGLSETAPLNQVLWIKELPKRNTLFEVSDSYMVLLEPPRFPQWGWLPARQARNYFELVNR